MVLLLLRLHQVLHCRLLVGYEGYSISAKGFLSTVVDIMVI